MKSISFLIAMVCSFNLLFAQQPKWILKTPKSDNSTFYYQIAKGYGNTVDEAKEKMYLDVKNNIAEKLGLPSTLKMSSSSQMSSNGEMNLNVKNNVDGSIQFSIPMRRVCDQITLNKDGTYISYGLYQVAHSGNMTVAFVDFTKCNRLSNNTAGLWRSAIIPGWGQMYKGQNGKGLFFLGSEVALVGTALYFQNSYQTNITKSQETTKVDIQKAYRNNANDDATVRNVAAIGAVAVYVWNLVDAISIKSGGKRLSANSNFLFGIDSYSYFPSMGYKIPF